MKVLVGYRKALVALAGTVLTWAGVAYVPDGHVDRFEWYALVLALATAASVYVAPNAQQAQP